MQHFTPTLSPKETAKNARAFVKANMPVFWTVWKPLIPFVVVLTLLDVIITNMYFSDSESAFSVGGMIAGYFLATLMITWHRVVIHGPDRYTPMKAFKPKRHELAFIFMPFLLFVLFGLAVGIVIGISAVISKILFAILAIAAFILIIVGAFRISFYFPGKAIGADMSFKKSWSMTKGYIWKMLAAGFSAGWRLMLASIAYGVVAGAIAGGLASALFGTESPAFDFMLFIALLPITLYFQALITIIGVTVVSNYYQWAINNPREGALA